MKHHYTAPSLFDHRNMSKKVTRSRKVPAPKNPGAESLVSQLQWPLLRPLVPTVDLHLQALLQDQIFVVSKLFTTSLCQKYISFLADLPLITTPTRPKKGDAARINDRLEVYDPQFATILFNTTGLETLMRESGCDWGGELCGLNPRIRIYRYTKGQFFDKHCKWINSGFSWRMLSYQARFEQKAVTALEASIAVFRLHKSFPTHFR